MEIIKTRKDLLYIAGTGFALIGIIIFLFFMPLIPKVFYGHWIFLLVALVFCLLPSSKTSFGKARQYSPLRWISLIFLMQVSVLFLHLGIFQQAYSAELVHYGLFPWGFVAILASAFAGVAYLRQENAFANALLSPLVKSSVDKPSGIIINNALKFFQSVSLLITFALMILLVDRIIGFNPTPPYSEPLPLFALLILILFSFSKIYNRLITRIFAYPTWIVVCVVIVVLGFILAGLHAISSGTHFSMPLPGFFAKLQTYPQALLSNMASSGWWLCLSILMSLFIGRISGGYSRRALIAATLMLPLALAVFLSVFPSLEAESIPPFLRDALGIFGFISCSLLFMNTKMLSPLVLTYLPKNGGSKYRNPEFLMRKLIQMTLIFLYIYLPIGVFVSAGFMFAVIFPFMIFACLLLINFCKNISNF